MIIQLLRSTYTNTIFKNPVLLPGQPLFITDTNKLYIGDGVKRFSDLEPVNKTKIDVRVDLRATEPYVEVLEDDTIVIVFPKQLEHIVSGGGISTSKVQKMIDEALSGYTPGTSGDMSNYTLLTTTQSISGNLQSQIVELSGGYVTLNSPQTIYGAKEFRNSIYAGRGTGIFNECFGQYSGSKVTTGQMNTCLGSYSLFSATSGSFNIAIGYNSQILSNGSSNTSMGIVSLNLNTTGGSNVAIGAGSLRYNKTGSSNTALGINSLYSNQDGNFNVGIGSHAGYNELTSNKLYIDSSPMTTGTSASALIYGDFVKGKVYVKGNIISTLVILASAPTPTASGIRGNYGYYNGHLYRWVDDNVVVRSLVETSW
jgi:hypothetical protein